jgi:NTE family protein
MIREELEFAEGAMDKKRSIGLVLSGGGGKGAYEVGVWRALDEYGITPNIGGVAGTSVGSLNAAMFAQGSCEDAARIWSTISPSAVLTFDYLGVFKKLAMYVVLKLRRMPLPHLGKSIYDWATGRQADQGLFSKKGLSELIDRAITPAGIHSFGGPVYVTVFQLNGCKPVYHDLRNSRTLDEIRQRLLASASIPVVYGKTKVDEELCWDGGLPGVGDNIPVKPLYNEGFRTIIVVHLSRDVPVDRSKFPDCRIIEIMPQEDLGDLVSGTLNFKADRARQNIERGYRDAVAVLEPIFSMGQSLNRIHRSVADLGANAAAAAEEGRRMNEKTDKNIRQIDDLLQQLDERGMD